jgi:hypothetical protein
MKLRRPFGVKLLAALTFSFALWYLLRVAGAILDWKVLAEYHARGGPLYIAISGGVWTILASIVGLAVWQGKPWAWGTVVGLAVGLGLWTWYDMLIMQTARTNGIFNLAITIFWLVVACLLLSSKKVRSFYHER